MKRNILTIAILLGATFAVQAQQLAFPGAEGFGRYATGGRTGSVYHVTNLNDDGPGSFRDAVSRPNRIVVFDVAGIIRINSRISVSPNLYIAGQTAPGEGVTIYGNGLSFSGADNTICRYLRVRMGVVGQKGADAIGIAHGKNMILTTCRLLGGATRPSPSAASIPRISPYRTVSSVKGLSTTRPEDWCKLKNG